MNLGSLRAAVLETAEAEAARRRTAGEVECEQKLAAAHAEASSVIERGRLEGRLAGEREKARRLGAARRRAREAQLGAGRALYEDLRAQALAETLERRVDAGYTGLLDRFVEAARLQLGADVEIEIDPPGLGGVRARSGNRSVDYTLPALVDRALFELDGEVERLWR